MRLIIAPQKSPTREELISPQPTKICTNWLPADTPRPSAPCVRAFFCIIFRLLILFFAVAFAKHNKSAQHSKNSSPLRRGKNVSGLARQGEARIQAPNSNRMFDRRLFQAVKRWYAWCDSNARHIASEAIALSSWATGAYQLYNYTINVLKMQLFFEIFLSDRRNTAKTVFYWRLPDIIIQQDIIQITVKSGIISEMLLTIFW